jgi:hypothetical protein
MHLSELQTLRIRARDTHGVAMQVIVDDPHLAHNRRRIEWLVGGRAAAAKACVVSDAFAGQRKRSQETGGGAARRMAAALLNRVSYGTGRC